MNRVGGHLRVQRQPGGDGGAMVSVCADPDLILLPWTYPHRPPIYIPTPVSDSRGLTLILKVPPGLLISAFHPSLSPSPRCLPNR